MKNFFKLIGIIALVAVIGFSMAACGDDEDNNQQTGYPKWPNGFYADYEHYYWQHSDGDYIITFDQQDQYQQARALLSANYGKSYSLEAITSTSFSIFLSLNPNCKYTITYSLSGDTLNITNIDSIGLYDDYFSIKTGNYTKMEYEDY
jgi:hypothetical protein